MSKLSYFFSPPSLPAHVLKHAPISNFLKNDEDRAALAKAFKMFAKLANISSVTSASSSIVGERRTL